MELPLELWLWVLGDPEHGTELAMAMEVAPENLLAKTYRACFPPHDLRAASLVKGSLNQLTNRDIVANLERIRERAPEVLVSLIKAWLEAKEPVLAGLAAGNLPASEWQADRIELGIWLWQEAGQPLPEFWRELMGLLHAAPAPVADPAVQAELYETQKKLQRYRELSKYQADKLRDLQGEAKDLQAQLGSAQAHSASYEQDAGLLAQLREEKQKWQDDLKQARSDHWNEISRLKGRHKDEIGQLQTTLKQLGEDLADITQERDQLTWQVAEAEQESDQLSQQLAEASQRRLRAPALPASAEIFQQALIIDYQALGQTPSERLIQLSDLYSSFLQNQPHPALEAASNWPDLKAQNDELSQILLLGLEQLLYDQASLPIASWLRTASFGSEALLAGLDQQLHSPRLR